MQKRGFLKLLGALAGGSGLALYAEPIIAIPKKRQWVEDLGDFYIVRVPDGMSLSNDGFDKPTIFQLGENSSLHRISVAGYSNLYVKHGAVITDSYFDCSKMRSKNERAALVVGGQGASFMDIHINGNGVCATMQILPGSFIG